MSLTTYDQLRDNIASTIRDTQVASLLGSFINLTGLEIHLFHHWSWLRRKTTFSTVASQEDYNLDAEIDRIALMRQITSPTVIREVSDFDFYRYLPNPESQATGNPLFYRRWEETGFATNLAAADTVYVVSSSASDGSSFTVIIEGRDSSGERVSESLTLNGTTNVTSTTTWAASGLMRVSKSGQTTGTVSVYRTTGATLLSELEPENLAPRYKRVSLYPIPSSAITVYLEYYERYRYLVNDADVPQMDTQWNWVLREGALARAWEYKQNETLAVQHRKVFEQGLVLMRLQDQANPGKVNILEPRQRVQSGVLQVSDPVSTTLPGYALYFP